MPLVEYSSSSSPSASRSEHEHDTQDVQASPRTSHGKRKRQSPSLKTTQVARGRIGVGSSVKGDTSTLPPLPPSFHDLYATAARSSTTDNPSLHGGRKRAVPHVEGNWPSHVYLEWLPSETEHSALSELVAAVEASESDVTLNSSLTSSLSTTLPLHVSLSAPLSVPAERKEELLSTLQRTLPNVRQFNVRLGELAWVSNDEKTRWFLILSCKPSEGDELEKLLRWCNGVCRSFGLRQLYVNDEAGEPHESRRQRGSRTERTEKDEAKLIEESEFGGRFHFSIAWSLQQPHDIETSLEEEHVKVALVKVSNIGVGVDSVKVKIGNAIKPLDLKQGRVKPGRGILG